MPQPVILFELAKLALQLSGTVLVAWLAVIWALRRYKSEKTWERRLAAYADAVAAISEMQLVVGQWFDEDISNRETTPEHQQSQQDRYQAARRRLDASMAAALLILRNKTTDLLAALVRELENQPRANTFAEHMDNQYGLLKDTNEKLVTQGRLVLALK